MSNAPKIPETDPARSLRSRNRALAFVLVGFVVLFFVMTLVRLGGNIADRTF